MKIDNKIKSFQKLAKMFEIAGFSLYLVGGSVRDFLLRLPLEDMDVVTDATPKDMRPILEDYRSDFTFEKYGSVKAYIDDVKFDITTLRKETAYKDNRHPTDITFVRDLKDDYKRRDFTINGMYLDKNFVLYDFCGGQDDLNKGMIRTIGNPTRRIQEDPLRIIRAIRFSLTYGLEIDSHLSKAIDKNKSLIQKLNYQKVMQEIKKIYSHDSNKAKLLMSELNLNHMMYMLD